ncbi:MAG: hypothetical protein AUH85_15690 [Chloroflexi bacterium 13_1_40CM_4_68_4]|nr:MAG: hypothetical protein AUH85_15690 [Chloroflexi bacterium 13_1_40CM_4_68_4]
MRGIAPKDLVPSSFPERRYREDQRAAGTHGIAAGDLRAVRARAFVRATQYRIGLIDRNRRRQRRSDEDKLRRATHGRDVRKVDRHALPSEIAAGRPATAEVHILDQHVRGEDAIALGVQLIQRGVVTDPEPKAATRARQRLLPALDQLTFAELHPFRIRPF